MRFLFLIICCVCIVFYSCRRRGELGDPASIGRGLSQADSLQALYRYLQRQKSFEAETLRFWVLLEWIEVHIGKNSLDSAWQIAEELDSLARRSRSETAPIFKALGWSMLYRTSSKGSVSDSSVGVAIALSESLGRLDLAGRALYEAGLNALKKRKTQEAMKHFQEASSYFERVGEYDQQARTCNRMGVIYMGQGRYAEADSLYRRAITLWQKGADYEGLASTYTNVGILYSAQGRYQEALGALDTAYRLIDTLHNQAGLAKVANNFGLVYYHQGSYPEALHYFQKALQSQEIVRDTAGLARSYNNIGSIFFEQRNYGQARQYYQKALAIRQALSDEAGSASLYSNIGSTYQGENKRDSALLFYQKALELLIHLKDSANMAHTYNNLGTASEEAGEYEKAIWYFQRAAELYTSMGDVKGLTYTYANIATLYLDQGKLLPARHYGQKALSLAQSLQAKERIMETALVLAKVDSALAARGFSDYWRPAFFNYYWYAAYKDSLFNEQNIRKVERLQAEYEHEKELALLQAHQEKERALTAARLRQKEIQRNYSLLAFGVTLLASLGITYFLLLLRRKNHALAALNTELAIKNAELAATNGALENSNQLIRAQAEALIEKNEHILASLRYAKRIQNAILPNPERWHRLLPQSFIWYMPRDIVAGDFYWLEEMDQYIFVAVADATGHGVPGAFVSLMCSSALSKAVLEEGLLAPAHILDRVKVLITERLTHEGEKLWDGMDIALFRLDKASPSQITFAGANRPLWLVTSQQELIEISPTRQPIGYTDATIPFSETSLPLEGHAPVMIYAFTDGLTDQLGGPQGRKLGFKRLREFFLSNAALPLPQQLEELQSFFMGWKGELPQVDDVTCMGLRIG